MPVFRVCSQPLRQARLAAGFGDICAAAKQVGCTSQLLTKLESVPGSPISEDLLGRLVQVYGCEPATIASKIVHPNLLQLSPEEIHIRRTLLGYSLQDMATLSGISFTTLWNWEQLPGLTHFDHNRLVRVAAVLECSIEDITVAVPSGEQVEQQAP